MNNSEHTNYQCLLCMKVLSKSMDKQFVQHMRYHKVLRHHEFLFRAIFLDDQGIKSTIEFMMNATINEYNTTSDEIAQEETKAISDATIIDSDKDRDGTEIKLIVETSNNANLINDTVLESMITTVYDDDVLSDFSVIATKANQEAEVSVESQDCKTAVCSLCGYKADNSDDLREHEWKHEIKLGKPCTICGELILNKKKHFRKKHFNLYECKICLKSVRNMDKHNRTVHASNEDKKYQCFVCSKGFILRDKLISHLAIHSDERPYVCKENCGYKTKTMGNLKKHESRPHNKERKYKWNTSQDGKAAASKNEDKVKMKEKILALIQ